MLRRSASKRRLAAIWIMNAVIGWPHSGRRPILETYREETPMIRVIAVGRVKDKRLSGLADDFSRRIRPMAPLEVVELKDADPEREGRDMAARLGSEGGSQLVVALDEQVGAEKALAVAALLGEPDKPLEPFFAHVVGDGLLDLASALAAGVAAADPQHDAFRDGRQRGLRAELGDARTPWRRRASRGRTPRLGHRLGELEGELLLFRAAGHRTRRLYHDNKARPVRLARRRATLCRARAGASTPNALTYRGHGGVAA